MKIGLVGLGRMGGGIRDRLRRHGHEVVGFARHGDDADVTSLDDLVAALGTSDRVVWSMVPAGAATESVIADLADALGAGDLVVDGGNANFHDSVRRAATLRARGIGFVDAGVSGGIWGLEEGFCLMVGGDAADVARLGPIFEALAPPRGFAHVGPSGAGHFTKMVHNGIEYGLMQAYAEGYELLAASELGVDVRAAIGAWQHGAVVRSWLLDLLVRALDAHPGLDDVKGWAQDSGMGRWTVDEAVRLAVPLPAITAALFARFASRQDDSPAMKVVAALREQFGGHAIQTVAPVTPS